MKTIILLVALFTAGPAWAVPLTWDFAGAIGSGTVTGSFTYNSDTSPTGYQHNNVTYALTDWTMTLTNRFSEMGVQYNIPHWVGFPTTITFSNTLANNTAELCVGECMFSPQLFEGLIFSNGLQTLRLEFLIPSVDPFWTAPPDTLEDWGPLSVWTSTLTGASQFKSYDANGNFQVLSGLAEGAITGLTVGESFRTTQPVPEPETWLLCLIGLVIVGLVQLKRRVV